MYTTYNKNNIYYRYDNYKNIIETIGTKEDFLNFLSRNIETYGYKDSSRWNLKLLQEQNVTFYDTFYILSGTREYPIKKYYLRRYTYFVGDYCIINLKDYLQEVFDFINQNKMFYRKFNYNYQRQRKYHCGYYEKHKTPRRKRTLTLNSIPEYKNFVRKKDKDLLYDYKYIRRVSCSWKDQTKKKRQYKNI